MTSKGYRRVLLLVVVVLAAAGCSSAHFTKPGANDLDWERDSRECERGASSGFYERCLQSRGWRKQ